MMVYLVLIGDIVSSREVEERHRLQETLEKAFQELQDYSVKDSAASDGEKKKRILAPYTLTLGDEFQALYASAQDIFRDSLYLLEKVYPHRVRFSYGLGSIETEINRQQAIGMDGTAFHNARDGIEALKNHKENYLFSLRGLQDEFQQRLFNHVLQLISNILQEWQKNRLIVLRKQLEGNSVKEISRDMDISTTAIYRNIYAGNIREMVEILNAITTRLNREIGES